MADQSMNLMSPAGTVIVATLERLSGRAMIVRGSARHDTLGCFEFEYEGTMEIFWDDQRTITRDEERVFLDENGSEFLESELKVEEKEPEDAASKAERLITVEISRGNVQKIEGVPPGVTLRIVDFDIQGADPEIITTLPSGEKAYVIERGGEPEAAP
jgi:hypothetical protein